MSVFWKSSFVTRLTVRLIVVIAILWFVAQFVAIYSYYNVYGYRWKQVDLYNTKLTTLQASVESAVFKNSENDLSHLRDIWLELRIDKEFALPSISRCSYEVLGKDPRQEDARFYTAGAQAIHLTAITSSTNYSNGFIYNKGHWLLFHSSSLCDSYDSHNMSEFAQRVERLQQMPSNSRGYIWGDPYFDQDYQIWRVMVAKPVTDNHGRKLLLGFTITLNNMVKPHTKSTDNAFYVVINDDGTILPMFKSVIGQTELNRLLANDMKSPTDFLQSRKYLVSSANYYGPPWKLVRIEPLSDVIALELNHILSYVSIGIVLLLLLTFILIITLHYGLAKPLKAFIRIINSTNTGDVKYRLPYHRPDELGMIAKAYNDLLSTVENNYQNLESQVALRTRELKAALIEAEVQNERKTEQMTMISHEVRTPLNGIIGALDLIEANPNLDRTTLVRTAKGCSHSLLEMINNILDFRSIEQGPIRLILEKTNLFALIDRIVLIIQPRLELKDIGFKVVVGEGVPRIIELDSLKVRQILVNLLANALKFTDEGSIRLDISCDNGNLIFKVSDTGIGITADFLPNIFAPYAREHLERVGTGLGLPISRSLAEIFDGDISVNSTLGKGSEFILTVPLLEAEYEDKLSGVVQAPELLREQLEIWGLTVESSQLETGPLALDSYAYFPNMLWNRIEQLLSGVSADDGTYQDIPIQPWSLKILLVDDVENNREIVGKMLESTGNIVTTVSKGTDALQLGQKHIFDLVLMDIRMREMDGIETFRRWKLEETAILDPDCPVIALTADTHPKEQARIMSAGFFDNIYKPVSLIKITRILAQVIDYQQSRMVDLMPNEKLDLPLFSLPKHTEKVGAQLFEYLSELTTTIMQEDWLECKEVLHALKGCAGLGGYEKLFYHAEQLELSLYKERMLPMSVVEEIKSLIE